MISICSTCHRFLGEKEGEGISHGYCATCLGETADANDIDGMNDVIAEAHKQEIEIAKRFGGHFFAGRQVICKNLISLETQNEIVSYRCAVYGTARCHLSMDDPRFLDSSDDSTVYCKKREYVSPEDFMGYIKKEGFRHGTQPKL